MMTVREINAACRDRRAPFAPQATIKALGTEGRVTITQARMRRGQLEVKAKYSGQWYPTSEVYVP